MTFQPVPWAVAGGALNPVEAARLAAYAATNGARGVVLPADCKVVATAVPDGNVQVNPGAVVIPNGATGTSAETYLGKNIGQHQVAIAPTGAGVTRSDLVWVEVSDPQYPGQPVPADVEDGPYIAPKVCAGVLPTTKTVQDAIDQGKLPAGTTGLALARVDMPASTGTVTQALIKDMRKLANPRSQREVQINSLAIGQNLTSAATVQWPSNTFNVDVPSWAVGARIVVDLVQFVHFDPAVVGYLRAKIGAQVGVFIAYDFEDIPTATERVGLKVVADITLAAGVAGTTVPVILEGYRATGTGYLATWNNSVLVFDVEFYEKLA